MQCVGIACAIDSETGKNGKTPQTCGRSLHGRKVLGSDDLLQAGQGTRGRGQAETDRGKNTGSAEGVSTMQPVPRRGYAGKAGFTTAARKQGNGRKTAGRADADIHGTTTRTADTARTADVSAGNAATDVRRVLPESGKRYPAAAHGISPNVSRTRMMTVSRPMQTP